MSDEDCPWGCSQQLSRCGLKWPFLRVCLRSTVVLSDQDPTLVTSFNFKYSLVSMRACVCSVMSDSANPWTITRQALSMGFPRQRTLECIAAFCSRDLPNPGVKPTAPALQVDSLLLSHFRSQRLHLQTQPTLGR